MITKMIGRQKPSMRPMKVKNDIFYPLAWIMIREEVNN